MTEGLDYNFDLGGNSATESLLRVGYEVQHVIGAGSGGQVFKACQRSTGQAVAIKLLTMGELEPVQRARRVERFRREIAFCSSLYHPDIVRLLDSGELEDGTRFAVFEFIPGRTLADLLRDEGMLKVQRARLLMGQALPPLAYAHGLNIAHRDLKPGNVMVTSDAGRDRLKILDFGISVSTSGCNQPDLARLTQSHEWVGTPLYAAPEQLRGEAVGARSDLYAWALMFVECLTGAPCVPGKSLADIIAQHFRPEPHVLPLVLAQHRLGALLLRVLEKDPARRLGDAQLVQSLLERISLDGLVDAQGYLCDVAPASAQRRARQRPTDTLTDAVQPDHSEQRHVTALCCRVNLVGAGALSGVEQIDALLDDSYNLIAEVLLQFGAEAAQTMGGYSLWYFGVTNAQNSDARLPTRAALEVVSRMEKLPDWFSATGLSLSVQIGLHNGPITVQLTDGKRKAVDGATARVAMELSVLVDDAAQASSTHRILVSDDFRQLAERYAEFEAHSGGVSLPWRATLLTGHLLKGESLATTLRTERALFVGRDQELEALLEAWRSTGSGQGRAILLEGEPGVGKSRLAGELLQRLDAEGCRAVEARCLPEWQHASMRPLRSLFIQLFGVGGVPAEDATEHLKRKAAELGLSLEIAVPLLCVWLGVPLPPECGPPAWSPQKQRQLLQLNVVEALLRTMEQKSVVLLEDLHWSDPSTLECVDMLVSMVKPRPVLLLLTARPGFVFGCIDAPERLSLSGLTPAAGLRLAASLVPEGLAKAPDLQEMVARSDGIPLYLEELAIALKAQLTTTVRHPGVALGGVPANLRHLLGSRLEDMGRSRETAQFAAALAREFSLELLAAVQATDELALVSDLEELVSVQILIKRLRVDSPVYTFRHALIRDAAYDSMKAEVRERSHERIAEGLLQYSPTLAQSEPDVLAYHFDRARITGKAIHYWELAAKRSSAASAHLEAIAHIDRALDILRSCPDEASAELKEGLLLLTRGAIIVAKRGYTDMEAKACFDRIVALVPANGPTLEVAFAARWGLWYFNNARCNLEASCALADELHELAQSSTDCVLRLSAWAAICQSRFCTGQFQEAVSASRRCVDEYDRERHRDLVVRYGDDPRVAAGSFEALAEAIRGAPQLAAQRVDELLELVDKLGYPSLKAGLHGQAAWIFLNLGGAGARAPRYERARQHAAEAVRVAQEHGFPFWELYGKMNELAISVSEGHAEAALELKALSEVWCSAGANLGRDWHLSFAADGLQQLGEYAEAGQLLDEALAFCSRTKARYFEPEVRRRRALLLADARNPHADPQRARAECLRAARDAERLGARWWQLASLVSALRLDLAQDERSSRKLSQLLTTFDVYADDPPLLHEARELVA